LGTVGVLGQVLKGLGSAQLYKEENGMRCLPATPNSDVA